MTATTTTGEPSGSESSRQDAVHAALDRVHRDSWATMLAAVARTARDIDLAEDALQQAFALAVARWPDEGIPERPAGWLVTTARRKAIDDRRREGAFARKAPLLVVERDDTGDPDVDGDLPLPLQDDDLRLIFTCCHPALAPEARIALVLRFVCGLATPDVARLLLVREATMAARLTRTRKKLREAGIPFRVPEGDDLERRLPIVLQAVYLLFTEGFLPNRGDLAIRADLLARADALATVLARSFPDHREAIAVRALFDLTLARLPARLGPDGEVISLARQDRSRWDRSRIERGLHLIRRALAGSDLPGPYALEATIAGLHADARSSEETDWPSVVACYDRLVAVSPSPAAGLARAVAYGEWRGPEAGLETIALAATAMPAEDHRPWAARALFLERLGRRQEAAEAMRRAQALAANDAERRFFDGWLLDLLAWTPSGGPGEA